MGQENYPYVETTNRTKRNFHSTNKMCKVHNTVGSLTTIKTHLLQNKIDDFNSINELLSFRNNYATARQQIISKHEILITEERNNLNAEILQLENDISKKKSEVQQTLQSEIETLRRKFNELADSPKSFIQEFTSGFKQIFLSIKIKYRELFFNSIVSSANKANVQILENKYHRLHSIDSNFDGAVHESLGSTLGDLDRKKRVIDEINNFIYGAIGEQKVVKELEHLSDDYILINNFSYTFTQPIYNRQERQSIKSIQLDHLLISPSGIFIIETKNWSNASLNNLNLYSPVDQIKRANYALFKLLSRNVNLNLSHHWGERKIPIRNLIVLINQKPQQEFQYVKILTLHELLGYVEYFKP